MNHKKYSQNRPQSNSAGFTLLELSIVILISAVFLIGLISSGTVYLKAIEQEKIERLMENSKEAISKVYGAGLGRYPCPANPALLVGDPQYGKEDCTLPPVGGGVLIGNYPSFFLDFTGEWRSMVGYLPRTDALTTNFTDPWGRPLRYAVTKNQTNAATYTHKGGAITVIDENGNNIGGTNGNAHFVVYSQGKDATCPTTGIEKENCDNNSTFRYSIQNNGAGTSHYDDYIELGIVLYENIWSPHTDDSGFDNRDVKNENTGNIGINTNTPSQKVEVAGDILSTTQVMSVEICDNASTPNCIAPDSIYDLECPTAGQYMKSISIDTTTNKLKPNCQNLTPALPANIDCGAQWVQGFYSDGTVVCN